MTIHVSIIVYIFYVIHSCILINGNYLCIWICLVGTIMFVYIPKVLTKEWCGSHGCDNSNNFLKSTLCIITLYALIARTLKVCMFSRKEVDRPILFLSLEMRTTMISSLDISYLFQYNIKKTKWQKFFQQTIYDTKVT